MDTGICMASFLLLSLLLACPVALSSGFCLQPGASLHNASEPPVQFTSFVSCFYNCRQQQAVRVPRWPWESFSALSGSNLKSFWGIFKHCFISRVPQGISAWALEWRRSGFMWICVSRGKLIPELQKRNPQTGSFASSFCCGISLVPACSGSKVPRGVSPPLDAYFCSSCRNLVSFIFSLPHQR